MKFMPLTGGRFRRSLPVASYGAGRNAVTVIPAQAGMTTTVDAWLSHYRHSRGSGNDSPHGVYRNATYRHTRASGNPLTGR